MKRLLTVILAVMLAAVCALPIFAAEEVVYLSDLTPTSAVIRNNNWPLTNDACAYYGGKISVAGVEYEKGISSHASNADKPTTAFTYDISAIGADTFTAFFGKDDGIVNGGPKQAGYGTVNANGIKGAKIGYAILVDNVKKDEGVVVFGEAAQISVDVKGAKTLTLQILLGDNDPTCDCGSFGDAKLIKSSAAPEETTAGETETAPTDTPQTADNAIFAAVIMTVAFAAAAIMWKKVRA